MTHEWYQWQAPVSTVKELGASTCEKYLDQPTSRRTLHGKETVTHLNFRVLLPPDKGKGKVKVHPRTGHKGPEREQRYSSTLSLTSAQDGCGWSTPRPGRFTPGKDQVPIVQEAGWAPGTVWTGAENTAPTGIRFPDLPARSNRYDQQFKDQWCLCIARFNTQSTAVSSRSVLKCCV